MPRHHNNNNHYYSLLLFFLLLQKFIAHIYNIIKCQIRDDFNKCLTRFSAIKFENIPMCYFYPDDFIELIHQTNYRVYCSYFRFDHSVHDYNKARYK